MRASLRQPCLAKHGPGCSCHHHILRGQTTQISALQFLVDDDEDDAGAAAAVPALPEPDAKRAAKRRKVRLLACSRTPCNMTAALADTKGLSKHQLGTDSSLAVRCSFKRLRRCSGLLGWTRHRLLRWQRPPKPAGRSTSTQRRRVRSTKRRARKDEDEIILPASLLQLAVNEQDYHTSWSVNEPCHPAVCIGDCLSTSVFKRPRSFDRFCLTRSAFSLFVEIDAGWQQILAESLLLEHIHIVSWYAAPAK